MAEVKIDSIVYGELVNLIYKREMDRIHQFNLMLVGLSGTGKSTLVKSLFKGMIKPKEVNEGEVLNEYINTIDDHGVKLRLRCIETSNFRSHNPRTYIDYIEDQFKTYYARQRRQPIRKIEDTRVHACLYLIPNYGKMRLEKEDIDCMKALQERVNLIPIISRSDIYTSSEKAKFKENILSDLKRHGINCYAFSYNEDEDEDRAKIVRQEAERVPFAVVAADEPVIENNRARWVRETQSGLIDINDTKYDFLPLAKLLIRHCMVNLIEDTHTRHYVRFKSELLAQFHREGPQVLQNIGLNKAEIGHIVYENFLRTRKDKPSLKQVLEEVKEKNAEAIRSTPSKISKPKPPIMYEKPDYLKKRVSGLYRQPQ